MRTVFESPALALLLELEDAAREVGSELTITITAAGRLQIAPKGVLTDERGARIREHRHALRLLVQIADAGVQARTAAFREQLAAHAGPAIYPALRFSTQMPGTGCISCSEPTGAAVCIRCQIAARLCRDGDVPVTWIPVGTPAESAAA